MIYSVEVEERLFLDGEWKESHYDDACSVVGPAETVDGQLVVDLCHPLPDHHLDEGQQVLLGDKSDADNQEAPHGFNQEDAPEVAPYACLE